VPSGWKVGNVLRWGDHETTARVVDDQNVNVASLYFQIAPSAAHSEEEAYQLLLSKPEAKVAQRVADGVAD